LQKLKVGMKIKTIQWKSKKNKILVKSFYWLIFFLPMSSTTKIQLPKEDIEDLYEDESDIAEELKVLKTEFLNFLVEVFPLEVKKKEIQLFQVVLN
jgi:hypothetical protein